MAFLSRPFLLRAGIGAWGFVLCLLGQPYKSNGVQAADEYHVKAIFLYNFAKFVEWPADMPSGATHRHHWR